MFQSASLAGRIWKRDADSNGDLSAYETERRTNLPSRNKRQLGDSMFRFRCFQKSDMLANVAHKQHRLIF